MFHLRTKRRFIDEAKLGGIPIPFINGYPSASRFIAGDPDHSFSIYNAFHRLLARNLLYLEAELFELQKEQDVLDVQDSHGDANSIDCLRSWKSLSTNKEVRQMQRMELVMKIRKQLKEYRKKVEFLDSFPASSSE